MRLGPLITRITWPKIPGGGSRLPLRHTSYAMSLILCLRRSPMITTTPLDRIGVGIDTARYGHRVSFLRPDRQPAAKPMTVRENHTGYQALKDQLMQLHEHHPNAMLHVRIDAAGQYAANLERF